MNLPEKLSFTVEILYEGKALLPMSKEYIEEIKKYDTFFEIREECKQLMQAEILNQFFLFLSKYPVLKNVLTNKQSIKNSLLLNLIEDSAKQNISDLFDIITKFLKFLDSCKGKYSELFKKKSQDALIEVLINGDPSKEYDFRNRNHEINKTRQKLFLKFNDDGCLTNESFEIVKNKIEQLKKMIKNYRDKVSAHQDKEEIILPWIELEYVVSNLKEIIFDFYVDMCFECRFEETIGNDLQPKDAEDCLIQGIYANN